MTIFTDDMDLAGEVVASLATFLNIEHLHSTADFPEQMDELHGILSKVPASFFTVDIVLHLCCLFAQVDEFHAVRQRMTAEMADHSNLIRSLVVRAEDSRLMGDM